MDDVLLSLLETAPHGLVAMDPDGTIRSANAPTSSMSTRYPFLPSSTISIGPPTFVDTTGHRHAIASKGGR